MGKKYYNIEKIEIKGHFLYIIISGQKNKIDLSKISKKIAKASEKEISEFEISPSGYGIHWPLLDEDFSIYGL
jgi:hypothetical protein